MHNSPRFCLRTPLPICKLLAEGEFFEFADGGAGDGVEEDEGVGELPLGEGFCEKRAQLFRCGAGATPEELRAFLAKSFAKWQLPDAFVFLDAIPRTSVGKFKKLALREQFANWKWGT